MTVLGAMLVLSVAACGERDEEKFTNAVNEICRESDRKVDDADSPEDVVAAIDAYMSDLKDVEAPGDKQSDYDEWIQAQEEQIVPEFKKALRRRDREALDLIDTSAVDSQAGRLGFDDCD